MSALCQEETNGTAASETLFDRLVGAGESTIQFMTHHASPSDGA